MQTRRAKARGSFNLPRTYHGVLDVEAKGVRRNHFVAGPRARVCQVEDNHFAFVVMAVKRNAHYDVVNHVRVKRAQIRHRVPEMSIFRLAALYQVGHGSRINSAPLSRVVAKSRYHCELAGQEEKNPRAEEGRGNFHRKWVSPAVRRALTAGRNFLVTCTAGPGVVEQPY